MRFSIIASTLPLLSLASAAVIAPRAESGATVLSQIEALTKKTESINPSVKALTDFPDFNKIRAVTDGLSQFNTLLQGDIQAMGNAYNIKISEAGQKNVCASYKTFKNQLTQTLQLLIGKSGIVQDLFYAPIGAALRSIEDSTDAFSFGIIDATPECGDGPTNDKRNLDETFKDAVCAFTAQGSLGLNLAC